MNPNFGKDANAQADENAGNKIRNRGARLSPRKLSPLTRQLILDEFVASGDMDEVAKAYGVPVRTVDSVLHWHALRRPPQPAREAVNRLSLVEFPRRSA